MDPRWPDESEATSGEEGTRESVSYASSRSSDRYSSTSGSTSSSSTASPPALSFAASPRSPFSPHQRTSTSVQLFKAQQRQSVREFDEQVRELKRVLQEGAGANEYASDEKEEVRMVEAARFRDRPVPPVRPYADDSYEERPRAAWNGHRYAEERRRFRSVSPPSSTPSSLSQFDSFHTAQEQAHRLQQQRNRNKERLYREAARFGKEEEQPKSARTSASTTARPVQAAPPSPLRPPPLHSQSTPLPRRTPSKPTVASPTAKPALQPTKIASDLTHWRQLLAAAEQQGLSLQKTRSPSKSPSSASSDPSRPSGPFWPFMAPRPQRISYEVAQRQQSRPPPTQLHRPVSVLTANERSKAPRELHPHSLAKALKEVDEGNIQRVSRTSTDGQLIAPARRPAAAVAPAPADLERMKARLLEPTPPPKQKQLLQPSSVTFPAKSPPPAHSPSTPPFPSYSLLSLPPPLSSLETSVTEPTFTHSHTTTTDASHSWNTHPSILVQLTEEKLHVEEEDYGHSDRWSLASESPRGALSFHVSPESARRHVPAIDLQMEWSLERDAGREGDAAFHSEQDMYTGSFERSFLHATSPSPPPTAPPPSSSHRTRPSPPSPPTSSRSRRPHSSSLADIDYGSKYDSLSSYESDVSQVERQLRQYELLLPKEWTHSKGRR